MAWNAQYLAIAQCIRAAGSYSGFVVGVPASSRKFRTAVDSAVYFA
jgi:hypothetical protein